MVYVVRSRGFNLQQWQTLVDVAGSASTEGVVYFAEDESDDKPGLPNYLKGSFLALTPEAGVDTSLTRFSLESPSGSLFKTLVRRVVPGAGDALYAWDLRIGETTLLAVRSISDVFVAPQFSDLIPENAIIDIINGL